MFSSLLFLALIITVVWLHRRIKALEDTVVVREQFNDITPRDAAERAVDRHVIDYHNKR